MQDKMQNQVGNSGDELARLRTQNRRLRQIGATVLIATAALFLMGQAAPKKNTSQTRVVWTATPIPDAADYKTYEDYAAAVVNWALNEKATTAGKQVSLNAGQSGRYQIVSNPNIRADTRLLDTQTGRTWINVEYTDLQGRPDVWRMEDRVDNPKELSEWWNRQTPIKK